MAATDYFEQLVLEHAVNGVSFSIPSWYIGLLNVDPTTSGNLTAEVTATDYVRHPFAFAVNFSNASTITWAPAESNWGFINYVALFDTSTKNTGKMLVYETIPAETVDVGVQLTMPAGQTTFSIV